MSVSQLAIYSSGACEKGYQVDIVLKDGIPWFRGCEVTKILGYQNGRDAMRKHIKEKYKVTRDALDHLGATQGVCRDSLHLKTSQCTFSEPGLYALILRIKMKEKEDFQD